MIHLFLFLTFYVVLAGTMCCMILDLNKPNFKQTVMLAILGGPLVWLMILYKSLGD